jgi:hypothetical protein
MGVFGRGHGASKREERAVEAFDRVRLDGIGRVDVRLGDADRVVVEAPEDVLGEIETRVERGVLVLGFRDRLVPRVWRDVEVRYEVTARDLRGVEIDGSGTIDVPEARSATFRASIDGAGTISIPTVEVTQLQLSIDGAGRMSIGSAKASESRVQIDGSGKVRIDRLEGKEAKIEIDGRGQVTAAGSVDCAYLVIDGTGDVDARELEARVVDVRIDGVGKVIARANETLEVRIDGFGRVEYVGSPTRIVQRIDGSGRVTQASETRAH